MVTVTAETSLPSSVDEAWTALGRRSTYFYFPGLSPAANGAPKGPLSHALDLPIVEPHEQTATLRVARAGADGRRERRFTVRGELVSIAGCWRIDPADGGVRVRLTLDYDIAPALKEHAVNTLRSRSPLPIRTDADAILSRAVDEYFETRFTEHAAAYCERLRDRLGSSRAS
ncbi:MAG TPA: hypothetical protein VJX92_11350 [Methylomirabilota bacterium]|nr:hypothetical protein [Methylomirabilota bacterium]